MKQVRFTLVEIVMVVALIAVLTGIAIGGYSYAMNASRESATRATLKQLESALESGKTKHGFYPAAPAGMSLQLFGANGAEIADTDLMAAWGNLPANYIRDFRRGLDMESLREHATADGYVADAWGNAIVYTAPDTTRRRPYMLRSCGPDGIANNDDDITN